MTVDGDAKDNYIEISGSSFMDDVAITVGGISDEGESHDNELVIESGSFAGDVMFIGGQPGENNKAYNNIVSILNDSDTACSPTVIGGYAYEATGNTVNIGQENGVTVFSNMQFESLYGGFGGTVSNGNKLNLYTRITADSVGGFQEMNFTLPKDVAADDTIISGVTSLFADGEGGETLKSVQRAVVLYLVVVKMQGAQLCQC